MAAGCWSEGEEGGQGSGEEGIRRVSFERAFSTRYVLLEWSKVNERPLFLMHCGHGARHSPTSACDLLSAHAPHRRGVSTKGNVVEAVAVFRRERPQIDRRPLAVCWRAWQWPERSCVEQGEKQGRERPT